jgi:hypothetical protein
VHDQPGHERASTGLQCGRAFGWKEIVLGINAHIEAVDSAYGNKVSDQLALHSDHQPFLLAGVPVVSPICDLGKNVYRCYHSNCDDIHLVDPQAMVDNVRYVGMLLYELAMADELPPAFTSGRIAQIGLIAAGLEEPFARRGRLALVITSCPPWSSRTRSRSKRYNPPLSLPINLSLSIEGACKRFLLDLLADVPLHEIVRRVSPSPSDRVHHLVDRGGHLHFMVVEALENVRDRS